MKTRKVEQAQAEMPEPVVQAKQIDAIEVEEVAPPPALITDTRPGGIVRGKGEGCRVPFGEGIRNSRK